MLHALAVRCLSTWDRRYHRQHRLRPVGPVLYVGLQSYSGADREFADGTVLRENDPLGVLHFNNTRIALLGEGHGRHRAAWEFTLLLRASLVALAEFAASSEGAAIGAYQGTTWMQPHGLKVGFTVEPLPPGWRETWLRWHFRILQLCFAPASFRSRRGAPEPKLFWITGTQLRQQFLDKAA